MEMKDNNIYQVNRIKEKEQLEAVDTLVWAIWAAWDRATTLIQISL